MAALHTSTACKHINTIYMCIWVVGYAAYITRAWEQTKSKAQSLFTSWHLKLIRTISPTNWRTKFSTSCVMSHNSWLEAKLPCSAKSCNCERILQQFNTKLGQTAIFRFKQIYNHCLIIIANEDRIKINRIDEKQ